jgi:hypothetical protein
MAVKIAPPPGFLRRFDNPIWTKLQLQDAQAISLVVARREQHVFTILELKHRSDYLLLDNDSSVTSTVFIVELPDTTRRWEARHAPNGFRVWADAGHLYLMRPGKPTPVREWDFVLKQALKTLETLVEVPAAQQKAHETAGYTSNADTRKIIWFLVVAGLLPGLEWKEGMNFATELMQRGYVHICSSHGEPWARVAEGSDAWIFALGLCLPLLGHLVSIKTVFLQVGRAGLDKRVFLTALLIWALAIGGLTLAFPHFPKAPALNDGRKVSCYSGKPHQRATPARLPSDTPEYKTP